MDGLGVISAKVVGRAASSSADKEKACDLDPSRQLAYLPHSSQPAAGPQMASRGEQVLKNIPPPTPPRGSIVLHIPENQTSSRANFLVFFHVRIFRL